MKPVWGLIAVLGVMAPGASAQEKTPSTPVPGGATAIEQALIEHACRAQLPGIAGEDLVEAEMPDEEIPRALTTLSAEGIPIFEVVRDRPALEELFLELTHGETV